MKITDEMVDAGTRAQLTWRSEACPPEVRAIIEAVAPMIARAEAEEIAGIARSIGERAETGDGDRDRKEGWRYAAAVIETAIRARHATPTPPRQSPPPSTPQI